MIIAFWRLDRAGRSVALVTVVAWASAWSGAFFQFVVQLPAVIRSKRFANASRSQPRVRLRQVLKNFVPVVASRAGGPDKRAARLVDRWKASARFSDAADDGADREQLTINVRDGGVGVGAPGDVGRLGRHR